MTLTVISYEMLDQFANFIQQQFAGVTSVCLCLIFLTESIFCVVFNGLLATLLLQFMWLDFQKWNWNFMKEEYPRTFLLVVLVNKGYLAHTCRDFLRKKCCLSQDLCLERSKLLPFPREMSHHILCILAKASLTSASQFFYLVFFSIKICMSL